MKEKIKYLVSIALLTPVFVSAALGQTNNILTQIHIIVRTILIPLVFALALLFFFWGVAKYIRSEGTGKEEGKNIMIWGIVGLFVMSAVWGLVRFIGDELGIQPTSSGVIPTIQLGN